MPIDLKREREKILRKAIAEAKKIGSQMALKRLQKNLKQNWVAVRMGITPAYLCDLENGKRNWRHHLIKGFLDAIGETNNKRKG